MKSILKFFGCLLLMIVFAFQQHVMAQNAEDYFHDGAQNYISGSLESAIARVQEGLSQYPNDPKLNELLTKLEEEQEQQQQQQQNQQQEQQNQDQENQNQDQQNQEQENQEEQEQQENEQNEENQEQNPEEQQAQPKDAREISKEEAQKILQALAQKEKELLKEDRK